MSEEEGGPRFTIKKRITDSGRSRIWYVTDSLGRFPSWCFNGPREELNRVHAATAANLLNKGYGYP